MGFGDSLTSEIFLKMTSRTKSSQRSIFCPTLAKTQLTIQAGPLLELSGEASTIFTVGSKERAHHGDLSTNMGERSMGLEVI